MLSARLATWQKGDERFKRAFALAAVAVLFFLVYAGTFAAFLRTWWGRDDYSHGFLVPVISACLVWMKRERLQRTVVRPDLFWGSCLLGVGCAMLFTGTMASVVMVQQASILAAVPGVVLLLFGRHALREIAFPIAYLVFMVPAVTDPLLERLHWPFQIFGAAGAAGLLGVLGIPVVRSQQMLELPGITLEVANECSGLRYLISIIALSLPLAHVGLRRWRNRMFLVASAVSIGILLNPARIALIGAWVYYRRPATLHGPGHIFQGFFVSMVGMCFLFGAAWGLAMLERRAAGVTAGRTAAGSAREPGEGVGIIHSAPLGRSWLIAVTMLAVLGGLIYLYRPVAVPPGRAFCNLPAAVGEWTSAGDGRWSTPLRLREATAEDEGFYRNAHGSQVSLYLGYLDVQSQGRELIRFTHQRVYDKSVVVRVPGPGGTSLSANLALVPEGGRNLLVLYWYEIGGRNIADRLTAKLLTAMRGLLQRRTNGGIVVVTRPVEQHERFEAARDEAMSFAGAAYSAAVDCFPREAGAGIS